MILNMLDCYKLVKENNISIIYSGPIWSDITDGIAVTLKRRMEFDKLTLPVSQTVFSVFVEQMNNVLMHSEEIEEPVFSENEPSKMPNKVFFLGVRDKVYFIQSSNIMKSENVKLIKNRIDYLNTLNDIELRQLYKKQIKSDNINPESKGAGIGLIEIARRASSKIIYEFEPYNETLTVFTMIVILKTEQSLIYCKEDGFTG